MACTASPTLTWRSVGPNHTVNLSCQLDLLADAGHNAQMIQPLRHIGSLCHRYPPPQRIPQHPFLSSQSAERRIEVLLRRIDELRVANAAPQVSVRYLGTVTNPVTAIGRIVLTQAAVGALASIVLTVMVIVVLEAMAVARRNTALNPKPAGD